MPDLSYQVSSDEMAAIIGQTASAGLGVTLAASIAGITVAPALLAGLAAGGLYFAAKYAINHAS